MLLRARQVLRKNNGVTSWDNDLVAAFDNECRSFDFSYTRNLQVKSPEGRFFQPIAPMMDSAGGCRKLRMSGHQTVTTIFPNWPLASM